MTEKSVGAEIYRKLPVEIEAVLFGGDMASADYIEAWSDHKAVPHMGSDFALRVVIDTPEGIMIAEPGDYIIRGVKGEFYPCKPDIFLVTYERV
jgi:hypothetical protein